MSSAQGAVSEVEATTAELATSESAVLSLKAEVTALAGKLSQLQNLQAQEAVQARAQQTAQKAHADLDLAHQNILRLNQRHLSQAMLVEPLASEEKLLSAKVTAAKTTVTNLDAVHRRAREALSKITSQRDLYSARRDRDQVGDPDRTDQRAFEPLDTPLGSGRTLPQAERDLQVVRAHTPAEDHLQGQLSLQHALGKHALDPLEVRRDGQARKGDLLRSARDPRNRKPGSAARWPVSAAGGRRAGRQLPVAALIESLRSDLPLGSTPWLASIRE